MSAIEWRTAPESHDETILALDMATSQAWDDFDDARARRKSLSELPNVSRSVMAIADWGVVARGAKVDRVGNELFDALEARQ